MTNQYPSNFSFLKEAYKDIIITEKETDQTGNISNINCQRKTFIFRDNSRLYITEHLKAGKIDFYMYDWYDKNNKLLLKFHSEPHSDITYQTVTEPYHIHAKGVLDNKRYPNPSFQDLNSILNFIQYCLIVIQNYNK